MPNQYQQTPIEILQARGINGKTLGGRDIEVHDVGQMVRKEPPPMPDGLAERGEAEWHKIWQAGPWLWPDQDYAWVEQVCRAYDDLNAFRAEIAVTGLMVEGYNGQMVANPLISEVRKAEAIIQKCLSSIGFSPSDRARLKLTELKSAKQAQDLVNGNASPGSQGNQASGTTVQGYVEDQW